MITERDKYKEQSIILMTSNKDKAKEFEKILSFFDTKYTILASGETIELEEPINSKTTEELVKKKTLSAFKKLKKPLIVEHTCLEISYLNDLPGAQSKQFFSKFKYEDICKLMHKTTYRYAKAYTYIGYCDGKNVEVVKSSISGEIADRPRGKNGFGWDSIFIPYDDNIKRETFSEMSSENKNRISMRQKAIKELVLVIEKSYLSFFTTSDLNLYNLKSKLKEMQDNQEKERNLILFVGAGVTRNAQFPSWWELLNKIGRLQGYSPDVIRSLSDQPLELAEFYMKNDPSTVMEVFNDQFNIPDKYLKLNIQRSPLFSQLVSLNAKRIYTTNYDKAIELAYSIYDKVIPPNKVLGLVNPLTKGKTEKAKVVKLHGDINDYDELSSVKPADKEKKFNEIFVLSESSYFKSIKDIESPLTMHSDPATRLFKQFYLDLKDDKNIILFIGYGLGDFNINYSIFNALENCKKKIDYKDRLFYFTSESNPVKEKIMNDRNINTIISKEADKKKALTEFLIDLNN